ncbi:hypothetical protein LWI28_012916 [Acer negundo]|uniref:CBS domain-containing protein n=1 Tax=Acer negundo TaxID=4023 RepID=A0AAD5JT40_ACENE|nr:hypothetical protein LWI28_012916 [Acer negundo]
MQIKVYYLEGFGSERIWISKFNRFDDDHHHNDIIVTMPSTDKIVFFDQLLLSHKGQLCLHHHHLDPFFVAVYTLFYTLFYTLQSFQGKMHRAVQSLLSNGNAVKTAVLERFRVANPMLLRPVVFSRFQSTSSARIEEHGFESTRIADVLKAKGKGADGSWLWCTTDDSVYDAVKSMTQHNVGALVVVKPGEKNSIAGIITERDYLRKIIVQGRSSKSTKVGDIMTEENKLITVTPDTKVLVAMQLMTENRIRHIPVIDDKDMIGMVSIGDVVRAVVSEHREELDRLNAFIQGGY